MDRLDDIINEATERILEDCPSLQIVERDLGFIRKTIQTAAEKSAVLTALYILEGKDYRMVFKHE